ncbi:MAG: PEGA domain-containing protein [Pseudomonadota bacterium]|nr:PEGA domain-containing protein [Pseudomonadota bacterium]
MPSVRQLLVVAWYSLALLFFPGDLSAKDPEWLSGKPENILYKFYVGVSTADDEASAVREAYGNAVEQAIRENFGTAVEIGVQTFESAREATYTRRVTEKSRRALIRGFEQKDAYRKDETLYVLFRYSREEIEKEKARLEENILIEEHRYTESSGSSLQKGGIEVTTIPEDVQVFIGDVPWGVSNLKLLNKVEPGLHTIRLEHPHFLTVFEEVIVVPNDTIKVTKTMVRAEGSLHITTQPITGAKVFIDGKSVGKTPIKCSIPAGLTAEVRIEHQEAEPIITRATVNRQETRSIQQNLVLKPSLLTITSLPEGAAVSINGKAIGKTPAVKTPIPARQSLTIRLTKEGYMDHSFTLDGLAGSEDKTVPPISLKPAPLPEETIAKIMDPKQSSSIFPSSTVSPQAETGGCSGVVPSRRSRTEPVNTVAMWKTRVRSAVYSIWETPPEISAMDSSLKTTYLLRISRTGDLQDKRLLISSGNGPFDRSLHLALSSVTKLPEPPLVLIAGGDSAEVTMTFTLPNKTDR